MKIIFGLGNPGKEYANTRHNIGFFFADLIQKEWGFSPFAYNKKFNSEISDGEYKIQNTIYKILIVKPQTFMNLSGEAVQSILTFYKLTPEDIIVIHDDLDIAVGKYKISKNISSAGHNGIDSIIEKIGTQDFTRVRIGVEMEAGRQARQIPGEDFVLQKFSENEVEKIHPALLQIIEMELPKLIRETN